MDEFEELKASVLGISFDTVEENAAFAAKCGFSYPLLCDTDKSIGIAYHAAKAATDDYPERISYLVDTAGNILRAYPSINAATFPAEVLSDLKDIVNA